MQRPYLAQKYLAPLALALLLAGCGGGSSGTSDTGTTPPTTPPETGDPTSGIDRGGIRFGSVTSFGSIVVGGIRYDVNNAAITVNGAPATQSSLAVGDVVFVVGEVDDDTQTGIARSVSSDDVLEGIVDAIDLATGELRVLEQTVVVTADTIFDDDFFPRSLDALQVGDQVEISGFIAADGRIVASRIEREDDDDDFEITGFVKDLDTAARLFKINDLVVDYSAASLDDFPAGGIADGHLVEVEGPRFESGTLFANDIDFKGARTRLACEDFDDDCGMELEGYISRLDSATSFDVDGFPVLLTNATVFEGGSSADLALNVKVEVNGFVDADGVLVAGKVEFEDDDRPIEIDARVQAVDATAQVITLLGIDVQIDARTRFEDFSGIAISPFRVTDIRVGDYLKVVGIPHDGAGAAVLATKIEREDDDDDVELQGFVEAIAEPSFTILGVTIQTTVDTEFDSDDGDGSQAGFFSILSVGDLVEVQGTQVGDRAIVADDVEIETDD
jgi:hypothetical protein